MSSRDYTDNEVTDDEITLAAQRITFGSICDGEEDLDDVSLMKKYIMKCPYLSPDSPAIAAALNGLDARSVGSSTPRSLSPVEIRETEDGEELQEETTMENQIKMEEEETALLSSESPSLAGSRPSAMKISKRTFLVLLRSLVFETPLTLVFAAYMSLLWVDRVHDLYLKPQLEKLEWSPNRVYRERTYYERYCFHNDMSTFQGSDLFLPPDATTEEVYWHQLKHGFSVFPGILSDSTATNLRSYVIEKNQALSEEEAIFVIANKNRYSFGLGTEEPTVVAAIEELTNNARLSAAMEKIIGKDAALIEMTAITSTYGARNQHWHDDVTESPQKYARAFGPSYSIFVQLQNTTKEMGATTTCPGTHYCPSGNMDSFCQEHGFQLVNHDGYWRAGDALLMNMDSWHRGAAHTDPNGDDRVMLILTFVPKPRERAESRQMAQGITFSLRWDMWGHTWSDLQKASTAMKPFWATLRALSLYKPKDASWGVDYISGSSMRIANHDNGFRRDELDDWIARGGFKYLPNFLEGTVKDDEESWYEYLHSTVLKCKDFFEFLNQVALVAYLVTVLLISLLAGLANRGDSKTGYLTIFRRSMLRFGITHGSIYLLYLAANQRVDNSDWAIDIQAGRRYSVPSGASLIEHNEYSGLSVVPYQSDVLIETLYKSTYLEMYNDFINGHPANQVLQTLVMNNAETYDSYSGLQPEFRQGVAKFIVSLIQNQHGRFLYQSHNSLWMWLTDDEAVEYVERLLLLEHKPKLRHLMQQIEFIISDCKFDYLRDTALAKNHDLPFWKKLKTNLFNSISSNRKTSKLVRVEEPSGAKKVKQYTPVVRTFRIPKVMKRSKIVAYQRTLPVGDVPMEPFEGAWRKEGDIVEAQFEIYGEIYWYKARIEFASPDRTFQVRYLDGSDDIDDVHHQSMRWFRPFYEGEVLQMFLDDDDDFIFVTITAVYEDQMYQVRLEDGRIIDHVPEVVFRRLA
mmetsp:Transcript_23893/g.36928  ORF Transcript_23893/g.36928 Transcript_23893/m.36928 type:complete len:971 (+) Transcript_23893:205-3117(+)|eukprot:CAMPEP_0195309368 /NCGR_PEP_ID=MMETSP0707-20130614/38703_1 /TAXON_ID=33640 /ORGANISM="Asterionellopsis glacialis, Strain CCMP134" /LENGTH=970 /DNA_ID=CAMNT_0040373665 /DNA_START=127 /DNA_END=3039 /DNA_ORIENTATION=+